MGHLIFSVVVNILGHVRVKKRSGGGVGWTSTASGDFAVLDSPEFVVLLPQIGFEDFGGGQEAQDGHITYRNDATALRGFGRSCQQGAGGQGCPSHAQAFEEGAALDAVLGRRFSALSTGLSDFGRRSRDEVFFCHVTAPVFSEMIVGDPVNWLWIHRKMKVGFWHMRRVMFRSKECQIICMGRIKFAFALAFASPLVYNPLAEVLVRLRHFC